MRGALLVLAVVGLTSAAVAQPEAGGLRSVCRLPIVEMDQGGSTVSRYRVVRPEPCPVPERAAAFEVTYTGFPPGAQAAFQAAVDTWACRIRSDQTIRIDASWKALGGATLGSAGPLLFRNFDGAPSRGVWYPAALADHLAGRDLGEGEADIEAAFNSSFSDWHFSLTTPPGDDYDLYTVVLHEIGHGLGLIGAMTVEEGVGYVGGDTEGPFVYDLLTEDASGTSLLDSRRYPNESLALGRALQRDVFVAGPFVQRVWNRSAPLFTPGRWVQGGSYSHLEETTFEPGTWDGLMTPFIGRGETIDEPGSVTCALLGDLGWSLAGECARQVGASEPSTDGLAAEWRGPNPVVSRTTIRLQSETPRLVRVVLYDMLGRRVREVGTAALVAGRPTDVEVAASDLAAGLYVLQVTGGGAPLAVPLTVVR